MKTENLKIGHIYEELHETLKYFTPIIKSKKNKSKILGIELSGGDLLDIEKQNLDYCDIVISAILDGKYPLKLVDDKSPEVIEVYSIDFLDNIFPLDVIDIIKDVIESIQNRNKEEMSLTFMRNLSIIVEDFLEFQLDYEGKTGRRI